MRAILAQDHAVALRIVDQANSVELHGSRSSANELLIDRYKEGKRVERISVNTAHLDPSGVSANPISRTVQLVCLVEHPRCLHRDLFTRSANVRSSQVEALLPDGPDAAQEFLEWLRGQLKPTEDWDNAPMVETRP